MKIKFKYIVATLVAVILVAVVLKFSNQASESEAPSIVGADVKIVKTEDQPSTGGADLSSNEAEQSEAAGELGSKDNEDTKVNASDAGPVEDDKDGAPVGDAQSTAVDSAETNVDQSEKEVVENNQKVSLSVNPIYLICILSLIVTLTLILVLRNLILWRGRLLDGQRFLMPESLIQELQESREALVLFDKKLASFAAAVGEELGKLGELSRGTREVAMSFQEKINTQDKELQAYREGYSAYLHRKFVGRFFRVYERLQKTDGFSEAEMTRLNLLFEDAFAEAHVELFSPEVGEYYPDITQLVEDHPEIEVTEDPSLDWKISSVDRPGMRSIENPEQIVVRAKVKVYRLKEETQ